jgi:hypothetical protein
MRTKTFKTQDIYPNFQTETKAIETVDISEQLSNLKFFCGQNVKKDKCCFSHLIGLPQHPATMQPMKFMPHQIDLSYKSFKDVIQ